MKNKKSNVNVVKTFLSTLIVIVLIAATVAIGFFSSGFRNWTKEEWKNVWDETFEALPEDAGNDPEIEESAISLNMSASEGSVSVSATITPSTASNKKVDWALSWKNPSSSWANGKNVTDYVSVTPDSDGSLTATVKALKAFSEQIILTCTARENANIKSTCSIDYSKKIVDIAVSIQKDGSAVEALEWTNDGNTYDIVLDTTFSEGTVEYSYIYNYTLEATDTFISSVQQTYLGSLNGETTQINLVSKTKYNLPELKIKTSYDNLTGSYLYFSNGATATSEKVYMTAVNLFKSDVESFVGSMFNFTISASNDYSTFEKTISLLSNGANFSVSVEDVTLSDSSIIF